MFAVDLTCTTDVCSLDCTAGLSGLSDTTIDAAAYIADDADGNGEAITDSPASCVGLSSDGPCTFGATISPGTESVRRVRIDIDTATENAQATYNADTSACISSLMPLISTEDFSTMATDVAATSSAGINAVYPSILVVSVALAILTLAFRSVFWGLKSDDKKND